MTLPLSTLLQISDSAFPTGAFAYSSGLEALARAGQFPTMRALTAYLEATLRQAAGYDLAFVAAGHAAYRPEHDGEAGGTDDCGDDRVRGRFADIGGGVGSPGASDLDDRLRAEDPEASRDLWALCAEWDATLWNVGMRTASLRQARAFVDAVLDAFGAPPHPLAAALGPLHPLREDAARPDAALHFAPALGYVLAVLGASRAQACTLYLHGIARDQAAAAVRLGLVGPRAAQALQARALAGVSASSEEFHALPAPRQARRTAPLIEAGQGAHGFLYSRLFQN